MATLEQQRGVTIVELMIGSAVGLFIIAGVLSVYLAVAQSSAETLGSSRLNQEMNALMNVMAGDIRRAGYWACSSEVGRPFRDPNTGDLGPPRYRLQVNPFSQVAPPGGAAATIMTWSGPDSCLPDPDPPVPARAATALAVLDAATNTATMSTVTQTMPSALATTRTAYVEHVSVGDCITYAYDADEDGDVDANEIYGFRLDGPDDEVQIRFSVDGTAPLGDNPPTNVAHINSCTAGNWSAINDNEVVRVTGLRFELVETCANAGDSLNPDCYANEPAAGSGDPSTERRKVRIFLEAELDGNATVKAQMAQDVFVRNDIIRVW